MENKFRFRDSHVGHTDYLRGNTKCFVFPFPLSHTQVYPPNHQKYTPIFPFQSFLNMTRNWESQAQKGKDILNNSIPKQWLLPVDRLPPPSQKSVVDFPKQSGLLNERELNITETSATELVTEMGNGKLSAEEVVVAFLKRAVLGHQLVRETTRLRPCNSCTDPDMVVSSILQRSLWPTKQSLAQKSMMSTIDVQGNWSGLW